MTKFKFLPMLVVAAAMLASCASVSKERATENRQVAEFNALSIKAPADVYFTQGETRSIKIVAPQSIIDNYKTEVVDGQLIVQCDKRHFWNAEADIYITAPTLNGISVFGAGDFECNRLRSEQPVSIEVTGAGDISIKKLLCPSASVNVAGAGDIGVAFEGAQAVDATVTGAGDLDLFFTKCGMVTCHVAGAGDINLAGEVRGLQKSISGVGDIDVSKLTILDQK